MGARWAARIMLATVAGALAYLATSSQDDEPRLDPEPDPASPPDDPTPQDDDRPARALEQLRSQVERLAERQKAMGEELADDLETRLAELHRADREELRQLMARLGADDENDPDPGQRGDDPDPDGGAADQPQEPEDRDRGE